MAKIHTWFRRKKVLNEHFFFIFGAECSTHYYVTSKCFTALYFDKVFFNLFFAYRQQKITFSLVTCACINILIVIFMMIECEWISSWVHANVPFCRHSNRSQPIDAIIFMVRTTFFGIGIECVILWASEILFRIVGNNAIRSERRKNRNILLLLQFYSRLEKAQRIQFGGGFHR